MKKQHISIDIETLGTTSTAPVIAVGAVAFDITTGEQGAQFYRRIDWESALKGRRCTAGTLQFWMKQDGEGDAVREILKPGVGTREALKDFLAWFHALAAQINRDPFVWGNGATFDIGVMGTLLELYGFEHPWKFWNVRDCRTMAMVADNKIDVRSVPFDGTKHNALADAKHQAKYVSMMWQAIRGTGTKMVAGGEPPRTQDLGIGDLSVWDDPRNQNT